MKKNHFFILIIAQFFVAVFLHAEEFVDKRFYQTFNPMFDGAWMRFTPTGIIEDSTRSYWNAPKGYRPRIVETRCKLLENKIGYIKYQCPKDNYDNGIVEVVITNCYSKFDPCALEVYVNYTTMNLVYWTPDGSRDDSVYNPSKPYAYDNDNVYKGCPKVFFNRKTEDCYYIRSLLRSGKFKYSDLLYPPSEEK